MAIILLVIAAVFLILGLVVLQEIRDTDILLTMTDGCNATDTTACDEAYQGANETIVGLGSMADFWTIIVLAIVITIVIGLLLAMFGGRRVR